MLLVIDAGNSSTTVGLYEGSRFRADWRLVTSYRTADELRVLFVSLLKLEGVEPAQVKGCCIASVVPQLNTALVELSRTAFGVEPFMIGPGIKTGLVIQVDNPKEVGADRIANAVGALEEHEGPLIVVDFGTATNFDVVSERSEYRGGIIVPGIQISADALFEKCAKLPRVDVSRPATVIGRDTIACIRSGLTYGYADMVDGLIVRMSEEMRAKPKVIATGGLAPLIAEITQHIDVVDPLLTLKGLRAVYLKNERAAV
jgi:type III pantothenate kinase